MLMQWLTILDIFMYILIYITSCLFKICDEMKLWNILHDTENI